MAITFTNLGASTGTSQVNPDIRSGADATSYTNSSWTPPSTGIVFAFVMSGQNTVTDTAVDSFDQNGVNFTRIGTDLQFDSSRRRISMFAAFASALGTGVTTVDFGSDTQLFCYVSYFQIEGADESGSISNAFVAATGTSGSGTSGSVTLASPGDSNNRAIAALGHVTNEVVTKGANFTKIDDMNGAGPTLGWVSEYSTSAFETTADASWTTSSAWGGAAAEVKIAGAGTTYTKQNIAISERVASGPRNQTYTKAGIGVGSVSGAYYFLDPTLSTSLSTGVLSAPRRGEKHVAQTTRLKAVRVTVGKFGNPTDDFRVSLYSDSSGSPGSAIASSDKDIPSIAEYTFDLDVALTAGTTYWIVFERSGASDSSHFYTMFRSKVDSPTGDSKADGAGGWGNSASVNHLDYEAGYSGGGTAVKESSGGSTYTKAGIAIHGP